MQGILSAVSQRAAEETAETLPWHHLGGTMAFSPALLMPRSLSFE